MIPLFKVNTDNKVCLDNVSQVLASGYIGEGDWVVQFEEALKEKWGCSRRVLTVNSCTSALELACHMVGVKGQYVLTTPQTCTATNTAIVSKGGVILWADVDQFSGNISVESVKKYYQEYGKDIAAIVCVDWGGVPCDYDELRAAAPGVPIIQDAAHSYLTEYDGAHITDNGGDYVCFSFQAIKHLTTIDGGAIVVPEGLEKRAELLRWYGLDRNGRASFRCAQEVAEAGFKFHMNNVAACIGLANMDIASEAVAGSKRCAKFYCENIQIGSHVTYVPMYDDRASYWIYTILVEDRESFMYYMTKHGVATSPVHARNDRHPCFPPRVDDPDKRRGIDYFSARNVALPCGNWVSDEEQQRIVALVNSWND